MNRPHGGTVVITEDDPDDRDLLRDAVRECSPGLNVQTFEDGDELLKAVQMMNARRRDEGPVLLLLDLNMPKKTGFEVLEELRKKGVGRTLPVVVVSTSSADTDVDSAYGLGANSFVTKPTTIAETRHMIRVLIDYWFTVVVSPV